MKVEVGQDALGRWAWMILDDERRMLGSGDDYYEATLAVEAGLAKMKQLGKEAGECSKSSQLETVGLGA